MKSKEFSNFYQAKEFAKTFGGNVKATYKYNRMLKKTIVKYTVNIS